MYLYRKFHVKYSHVSFCNFCSILCRAAISLVKLSSDDSSGFTPEASAGFAVCNAHVCLWARVLTYLNHLNSSTLF